MKKRIGIQGSLIFLSLAVIALFPKFFFSARRAGCADSVLGALGLVLVLAGFLVRIVSRGYKAEGSSDGKTLIRHGPYMLMRNPMYCGTFLIGIGIITAVFQWWVFALFAGIYGAIYIPQIRKEEKVLKDRFGRTYEAYCRATPRYFPGPVRLATTDPRTYARVKWVWVKKELPPLAAVVLFLSAIFYYAHGRAPQ